MDTIDRHGLAIADHPGPIAVARPRRGRSAVLCTVRAAPTAVPELRNFARHLARQWAIPAESSDVLSLVVSELVTNAVLHSGSPDVTALIIFTGVGVTVKVVDSGRWLSRGARRRMAEDDDAGFGRGLELVRACTSWCTVDPTATGTRVVAHLPIAEPIG